MLEESAKLIPTIAAAILASGNAGIIALLAVILTVVVWLENRTLRKRVDDLQEKRVEQTENLVRLAERFTSAMQDALSALYKGGLK